MKSKSAVVYLTFSFIVIQCNGLTSVCKVKEFCGDCIQEPGCVWCSKPNALLNQTYCSDKSETSSWCPENQLVEEQTDFKILRDLPLSQADNNIVQIHPQSVKLRIRKGTEHKINFQYQQAKNYPIDLYFLMDLSASMEPYRADLGKLGGQLAEKMKKLTSNFRLGFGSFVDKRDLPFINTSPSLLKNPCGKHDKCEPAYSFKNHLSLTPRDELFTNQVKSAKKSGNVDSPEGGFDALMQTMVCNDTIGWRTEARRLIVFATDSDFHIAGDGKLAGVVEPNDAKCHMKDNEYTDDLIYDYPSVSQINYIASENNFNVIFAIVDGSANRRIYDIYETLSKHIDNSGIGPFGRNTGHNNIVNLITDNYNKIVDKITITDNSSADIQITYTPNCSPGSNDKLCNNIQLSQVINFTATVRPMACFNSTQSITIKPGGVYASLNIQMDVVCECDCERADHPDYEPDARECNGRGDKRCGVCRCDEGRYGHRCQCEYGDGNRADENKCVHGGMVCGNVGECICGQCVCRGTKYGKHCECDDTACRWYEGKVCGGRGRCECGQCRCEAGWRGAACHECEARPSACIAPGVADEGASGAGRVCSGRGECTCGRCVCDASRYAGEWCEETLDTAAEKCEKIRACLECSDNCEEACSNLILNKVPKFEADEEKDGMIAQVCRYNDYCTNVFTYIYTSKNTYNVTAIEKIDCNDPMKVIGFLLLYIIGSILLAGILALIIWKCCTTVFDRREYARFENEQKNSKWHTDENPLFRSAVNTFQNPTYNRRSIWRPNSK